MLRQILYCTTDCIPIDLKFQEKFPTDTQVGTAWVIEMTVDRKKWSELPMDATTVTRTIGQEYQSSGQVFHNVYGLGWQAKSKAATPWRFVAVEPNHSWWWPFKSPTNRKEARSSSACTAAIDVCKQSIIQSSRSGMWWRLTHKSSVSHHKP